MYFIETVRAIHGNKICALFLIIALTGCVGTRAQSPGTGDYVEVSNPALTMSPGAPEKIWVPRKSVESGVPRGGEVINRGYEAVIGGATVTPTQAGIAAPGGNQASFIPRFGLVVAVDGNKVYFNLGRESGITPFQKLKVYRGGTVVEGLGLAPGLLVATVEVQGFVGTGGGYGTITNGGSLRINDLVGIE